MKFFRSSFLKRSSARPAPIGLVLTGGGARAAYQVGVLSGIRRVLLARGWPADANPIQVFSGTSAGAINATVLASGAHEFFDAVARLALVWGTLEPAQIFRVDAGGAIGNAAQWLGGAGVGWLVRRQPHALFDTRPLNDLLVRMIDFGRLEQNLEEGRFNALAVSASSYTSGHHVTFFQSRDTREPVTRSQRIACPAVICADHLMASSAIPFMFPAIPLIMEGRNEYFGDGSIRQTAPISPAIHLGARKILVVGSSEVDRAAAHRDEHGSQYSYPSLAQVGAHALASIFLDALASDLERLERINRTLTALTPSALARSPLKPLQTLVISPSRALDRIAEPHVKRLPRSMRTLLRVMGATRGRGAAFSSYLLFHRSYTRRLLAMGRRDALAKRAEIERFFGLPP